MTRLRQLAQLALQVEDTPTRAALAFALGVFIAFSPFLGIHTAIALGLAFLFRLNRVAILAGTFTNNPWTIAPMYTAGTLVGCGLLRVSPTSLAAVDWSLSGRAFYESLLAGLGPLRLPFVVGNLVLGAAVAFVVFVVVRAILVARGPSRTSPAPGAD
jgi:uncharacterized protein (DUF2062 family)